MLGKPELLRLAVKEELFIIKEKYNNVRRTQIVDDSSDGAGLSATDLLPDELVWVMLGEDGTVARTAGRQTVSIKAKPDELPRLLIQANTQDILYLFGADGQAVSLPVYKLPQAQEIGKGTHWADLTGFTSRQFVSSALIIPASVKGFLILGTIGGMVKRIRLEELPGITGNPFPVMNVADDDSLGWANLSTGKNEIVLVTASGQAIRFEESSVRPMGLPAGGVKGIKLAGVADGVVAMDLAQKDAYLWSITDNGLAKASPMAVFPVQGRYGQGVINVRLPRGAAEVVASVIAENDTTLIITMANGSTKSVKLGKTIKGNRPIKPRPLIKLGKQNRITGAVAMISRQED